MPLDKHNLRKCFPALCGAVFLAGILSGCVDNKQYVPSVSTTGRNYNASDLVKDWRSQFRNNPYPADNDSEYSYPVYNKNGGKYKPPNPYAYPYIPPNPYAHPPYPQDNDAGYVDPYPTYDPEADNSGFNYPLYFDE